MQQLTPEELDIIREFQANQQREPGPADLAAAAPPPAPDLAKPYNDQAAKFNTQADTLDQQAQQPAPQPQGRSQHLVEAARAAMENFGRLGAPGGYYGQQEQRNKDFTDANKSRIEQAKALRGEAAQQQQLGQQKTYQAGELSNQAGQLDVSRGNLAVSQQDQATKDKVANQPKRVEVGNGGINVAIEPNTGMQIPGSQIDGPEKPTAGYNLETKVVDEGNGKFGYHAFDMRNGGRDVGRMGDAPPPAANGAGAGGLGLVQSSITGPDGNPTPGVINLRQNTFTPAHMAGDKTNTPLQTSDAGKANVKVDAANMKSDEDRDASLSAIKGLIAKSAQDPNSAYINDQGLVDQFFNIVKPDSGARMNQAYIQNLLTPGPAADKIWAFTQKLSSGAPLTQLDREYMGQAAQIVADAKRHGSRNTVKPAPGGAVVTLDDIAREKARRKAAGGK